MSDLPQTSLPLIVQDWGLIDYKEAWIKQKGLVSRVAAGEPNHLVFCSHPPTVTLGRKSVPEEDLLNWQGPTFEIERGGRATYHGPHQLVVYPIFSLERFASKPKDIKAYLEFLVHGVSQALTDFCGLPFEAKTFSKDLRGVDQTGVWINEKKVASVGVGIKSWVSYHGVAINLRPDEKGFASIRPCGFSPQTMTSLEELGISMGEHQTAQLKKLIWISLTRG